LTGFSSSSSESDSLDEELDCFLGFFGPGLDFFGASAGLTLDFPFCFIFSFLVFFSATCFLEITK